MPKFKLEFRSNVEHVAIVTIEAKTAGEALEKAKEGAVVDALEWGGEASSEYYRENCRVESITDGYKRRYTLSGYPDLRKMIGAVVAHMEALQESRKIWGPARKEPKNGTDR